MHATAGHVTAAVINSNDMTLFKDQYAPVSYDMVYNVLSQLSKINIIRPHRSNN